MKNNIELIKCLVENGAKFINGEYYIHVLYMFSSIDSIKYLIEKGADVNIQNEDGKTVLYRACSLNDTSFIEYLVDIGATFGQDIENIYNLFQQSPEYIRQQLQEFVENDDSCQYFPVSNIELFNYILSLKIIPGKYNFFKSDEFKEKLLADVINQLTEENCEYKGRLLFYMKGVDHIQKKVRDNLKILKTIKID